MESKERAKSSKQGDRQTGCARTARTSWQFDSVAYFSYHQRKQASELHALSHLSMILEISSIFHYKS